MGLALMTARMMQQVFQLSFLDQLVQVIPEVPTILGGVPVVLVVLVIKVPISLCRLSRHLIRPSEVWFALDFFQHLMYRFSEYSPDVLRVGCVRLPCEISPQATVDVSI